MHVYILYDAICCSMNYTHYCSLPPSHFIHFSVFVPIFHTTYPEVNVAKHLHLHLIFIFVIFFLDFFSCNKGGYNVCLCVSLPCSFLLYEICTSIISSIYIQGLFSSLTALRFCTCRCDHPSRKARNRMSSLPAAPATLSLSLSNFPLTCLWF